MVLTIAIRANIVMTPGDIIQSYYQLKVTKYIAVLWTQWLTSSAVLHLTHMVTLTDLFTPAPQHRARC